MKCSNVVKLESQQTHLRTVGYNCSYLGPCGYLWGPWIHGRSVERLLGVCESFQRVSKILCVFIFVRTIHTFH